MPKKKIALEDLALMIKKGFDGVDKRFDKNDEDHEFIRKEHIAIRFDITELVRREEFLELKARLEKVETRLGMRR